MRKIAKTQRIEPLPSNGIFMIFFESFPMRYLVDSWASTMHEYFDLRVLDLFSPQVFPVPKVLNLARRGGFQWQLQLFAHVFFMVSLKFHGRPDR